MQQTSLTEFGKIDQTGDPASFIRFLDAACAQESFHEYKQQLIRLLDITAGKRILDVGCGTGDDAREMARFAGAKGRIVGVDNSQAMIAEARKRAEGSSLSVEFHTADALNLPYDPGSFDAACADRSLMHVPDARQVLSEMLRVVKPGGRVAIYEVDFGAVVIDAEDRVLARKVIDTWCTGLRNPWLGRRIPGLLRDLGLQEMRVTPHTLILTPAVANPILGAATVGRGIASGALTADEGQNWVRYLDELQSTGRFFSTMTGFLVSGSKAAS